MVEKITIEYGESGDSNWLVIKDDGASATFHSDGRYHFQLTDEACQQLDLELNKWRLLQALDEIIEEDGAS